MESLTKTGNLRSDPTIKKNGNMSYATFSFYDSTLHENGEVSVLSPAVIVYVVAFGRIADLVENSLRNGYTVVVNGHRQNRSGMTEEPSTKETCVNMVAEKIRIVNVPGYASRVPQPLKKSESTACMEEYKANGGFRKAEPVTQSWEDDETVEDFYHE